MIWFVLNTWFLCCSCAFFSKLFVVIPNNAMSSCYFKQKSKWKFKEIKIKKTRVVVFISTGKHHLYCHEKFLGDYLI